MGSESVLGKLPAFKFVENIGNYEPTEGFFARVPRGIEGREQLFETLRKILALPSYFGFNWDALDECLRDFHWIDQKLITIIHEDLPLLDKKDINIYLEILDDSVKDWKEGEEHQLEIVFPASVKDQIAASFAV